MSIWSLLQNSRSVLIVSPCLHLMWNVAMMQAVNAFRLIEKKTIKGKTKDLSWHSKITVFGTIGS